eukprot:8719395-Ditylum_brightwellii.AAC.1
MIKIVNNVQKLNNKKGSAESDSENSKSNDSSDEEDEENENKGDTLPIAQDNNNDSETVTKELSEDKTSVQVVIEDKQKNLMKTTMTRVMKTKKQKLLQEQHLPHSNEELEPGKSGAKHE